MKKLLCIVLALMEWHGSIWAQTQVPEEVVAKILEGIRVSPWRGLYYDLVSTAVRNHGCQHIVEVGVAFGSNAEYLLQHTKIQKYIGVDPYIPYDAWDGFHEMVVSWSPQGPEHSFDCLFEWVKNTRLAPHGERCQLIRKPSAEAAADFEDNSLDCVFLDGDHRYQIVLQDLKAWYPKLKPGGMMLGDDYYMVQVADAVHEFFDKQNKEVFFLISDEGYKIWGVYK